MCQPCRGRSGQADPIQCSLRLSAPWIQAKDLTSSQCASISYSSGTSCTVLPSQSAEEILGTTDSAVIDITGNTVAGVMDALLQVTKLLRCSMMQQQMQLSPLVSTERLGHSLEPWAAARSSPSPSSSTTLNEGISSYLSSWSSQPQMHSTDHQIKGYKARYHPYYDACQ